MVRATIFDIDGTIIDSVDAHIEAWQRAFARYGKETSREQIRQKIGEGADEMLPVFFSQDELRRFRSDLEKYRSGLFKREYLPLLKAFPRVRELFQRLKDEGKKIALGSTAKGDEIAIYKEIAQVEDLVDCVACSEEVKKSKPHSDICAAALRKLDEIPARVIAIGDTAYDVESAGKIDIATIGLLCGGGVRDELEHAGCVAIYENPAELFKHYTHSPLGPIWNYPAINNVRARKNAPV
jgi:phosphoglycolate phosphatase-like HAD superfamily hydrolase